VDQVTFVTLTVGLPKQGFDLIVDAFHAYAAGVDAWALFLGCEEGLAETTAANYCWWTSGFLEWLQQHDLPLRRVTLAQVDQFMNHLRPIGTVCNWRNRLPLRITSLLWQRGHTNNSGRVVSTNLMQPSP
jgi:hypothetical protein